jgi:hypothetical protein
MDKNIYKIYMGGGFHKPGSRSYMVEHGFKSKYERNNPNYYNERRHSLSPKRSPTPPRRSLTQAEENEYKAAIARARVNAIWRNIEEANKARVRAALIQKNEAKRKANLIKQHNRLAAAAAVNVKNVNKIFKNNKTILGRMRRLAARLSRSG